MKPIKETHPSLSYLSLVDNSLDGSNIENYGEKLTNDLMLETGVITTSVGLIQKHTIDKAVLREAINKTTEGYEDGFQMVADYIRDSLLERLDLMKELGLEEK